MLHFVDVSNHQQGIDLSKIDSAALIFKATEGRGWRDKSLPGFVAQARKLGKPVGFYHFVSQGNAPAQEAQNFLDYTAPLRTEEDLLVLDWEPSGTSPSPRDVGWAREWLTIITNRVPNPVWIYMNLSTANGSDWGSIATEVPLWLAHYPANNPTTHGYNPAGARGTVSAQWKRLAAWQFTDQGRLPGWGGNLDLNELYLPWWTDSKESLPVTTIPTIRENDPPVHLFHHHGGQLLTSRGAPRLGCVCMQLTFPLIEQEMIRRGLITHQIDVFQGGYNKGVAASAGTHDMGGVIDVAQGITRDQRVVWADFGVMMFPRTRQYGWRAGDHGHGVWHGCNHRTASAARQVRDGIAGRDGLVSNTLRNFVAPQRTWQDAYRATVKTPPTATKPATPHAIDQEDPVPKICEVPAYTIDHAGEDWQTSKEHPLIGADVIGPIVYDGSAIIMGPEGADVSYRWAVLNRQTGEWTHREDPVPLHGSRGRAAISNAHTGADPEVSIFLDVLSDKPGKVLVTMQRAKYWVKG